MQATFDLHNKEFEDLLAYMEQVVVQYVVELLGSNLRWIPLDFIKHIYKHDKSFRFKLNRFLKGLTNKHHRCEDDQTVYELNAGNVGNSFLSWDMTLCLFLHEGKDKAKNKEKVVDKSVALIKEAPTLAKNEEVLLEVAEASMALLLLQQNHVEENDKSDQELEADEIVDAIPELDVTTLSPIIMDSKEFLFLDDISKSLGLREDEALIILSNSCGSGSENIASGNAGGVQIDFDDHDLTKQLGFIDYDSQRTIEETVVNALTAIQEAATEDESVPEEAFQPHKQLKVDTSVDQRGSIDIC